MPPDHPLAALIADAARGRFPEPDGGWRRVPPWRSGLEAVLAFTAHAVFCLDDDITDERLRELGPDGAHEPHLLVALSGEDSWIGCLDVLLVGRGTGAAGDDPLVRRPDLAHHPRVDYAARLRDDLQVLGLPDPGRSAVAVVGRGVAGLPELSFELETEHRGAGEGRAFVEAALGCIPRDELVVACVAPGNAASLRSVLRAGFVPVGSLQLLRRRRQAPSPPGAARSGASRG